MTRCPLIFLFSLLSGVLDTRGQSIPMPPLPGEEGPVTPTEAFQILPGPGEIPPESEAPPQNSEMDENAPIAPMPEQMPEFESLLPPIDDTGGDVYLPLPLPDIGTGTGSADVPPLSGKDFVPDLRINGTGDDALASHVVWHKSPRVARQLSITRKTPLLLFFASRSRGDGLCPTIDLNDDLFTLDEFNEFAAEKLILTHLYYPSGSPNKREFPEEKLAALAQFKDFFKVRGFPTVILLDEDGHEILRIRKYSRIRDPLTGQQYSTASNLMDQIRTAVKRLEERREASRQRMESLVEKGYRIWRSRAGSEIMARFGAANAEEVLLMDDTGRQRRVLTAQLTLLDAEWARRELQKRTADLGSATEY